MTAEIIQFNKKTVESVRISLPYNLIAINAAKKLKGEFDKATKDWVFNWQDANQAYWLEDIFNSSPTEIGIRINRVSKLPWVFRTPTFNCAISLFGVPVVLFNKQTKAPYLSYEANMNSDCEIVYENGRVAVRNGTEFYFLVPWKILKLVEDGAFDDYALLQHGTIHSELKRHEFEFILDKMTV